MCFMIYTSNYKSIESSIFNPISISWDKGSSAGFNGDYIKCLAPKLSFFRVYKQNKGIIDEDKNNRYYIYEYYKQVLSLLDPSEIYEKLNNRVMLCYENNMDFCHRHLVSAWLELFLNIEVFEVIEENKSLKIVDKPLWIKNVLDDTIKSNMNMYGFKSIRAAYLYNLSIKCNSSLSEILLFAAAEAEDNYVSKVKIHKI